MGGGVGGNDEKLRQEMVWLPQVYSPIIFYEL